MSYLKNKKGVVMGVANDHSIAWGIAKKLSEEGAELCFTYQGDSILRRVKPLAESINNAANNSALNRAWRIPSPPRRLAVLTESPTPIMRPRI